MMKNVKALEDAIVLDEKARKDRDDMYQGLWYDMFKNVKSFFMDSVSDDVKNDISHRENANIHACASIINQYLLKDTPYLITSGYEFKPNDVRTFVCDEHKRYFIYVYASHIIPLFCELIQAVYNRNKNAIDIIESKIAIKIEFQPIDDKTVAIMPSAYNDVLGGKLTAHYADANDIVYDIMYEYIQRVDYVIDCEYRFS